MTNTLIQGIEMKKFTLLAAIAFGTLGFAECTYEATSVKNTWKAFKTYEKLGVGGSFDQGVLTSKPSSTLESMLTNSSLSITTAHVNSGNAGRDATLVASFFKTQGVSTINAKIKNAANGKALTDITMNGVTKTIPMNYTTAENKVVGKGIIDLADFAMLPSLSAINKACYDLHAGKTWQDVEIGFEMDVKKKCD